MSVAYRDDQGTRDVCRKLLTLTLIPQDTISGMFEQLAERATTPGLRDLFQYVRVTWIESALWPPSAWSVFGKAVRTNNDVEGWHRRINERARHGQLTLYLLVTVLHEEPQLVSIQSRLVSEHILKRHQRVTYLRYQARPFKLWQQYSADERSVTQLLAACAKAHGPIILYNTRIQY